ncbi:hypothetical protein K1719_012250 [Acacia pycnantha]|nr:hypothetical protein K1719_012250 [Acacia pycnantha]
MQKMIMMDNEVFPELSNVTLRKLPMLVTVCEGIDFQTLKVCGVDDCPKYQEFKEAMTTSVEEVASSFNYKETKKEGGRVVLDPVSKLPAPTSSSFQSSEKTEKEAVRIQTSQLSIDPTWTNSEITQSIKDTKEHGHEENCAEEYSYSRKQSIGPIDNLPRKDCAPISL